MGFLRFSPLLELWCAIVKRRFGIHIKLWVRGNQEKLWDVNRARLKPQLYYLTKWATLAYVFI